MKYVLMKDLEKQYNFINSLTELYSNEFVVNSMLNEPIFQAILKIFYEVKL